jgi:hypothetical protein
VSKGERVLICNHPITELLAVEGKRTAPRPTGLGKGTVTIPPSFFEPLPDDELDVNDLPPIYPRSVRPPAAAAGRAAGGRPRRRSGRKQ